MSNDEYRILNDEVEKTSKFSIQRSVFEIQGEEKMLNDEHRISNDEVKNFGIQRSAFLIQAMIDSLVIRQ